jgi:hypothetical protein
LKIYSLYSVSDARALSFSELKKMNERKKKKKKENTAAIVIVIDTP